MRRSGGYSQDHDSSHKRRKHEDPRPSSSRSHDQDGGRPRPSAESDVRRWADGKFFGEDAYIRRDSPLYEDFWEFRAKFVKLVEGQARAMGKGGEGGAGTSVSKGDFKDSSLARSFQELGLPPTYDLRYRSNVTLVKESMTENRGDIKRSLHMFEDYRQKRCFAQIRKLQRDRAALPMAQYKKDVVEMVRKHSVVVIAGDTGCGKSTQVPQYLMDAGFTKIACTQPRRISTIGLSRRVATETLNEYGSKVSYQIRFETTKTEDTQLLFVTEGLLLRQLASDPLLLCYNVVIIDEAHERHLNCDILLGCLRRLVVLREDLRIILMSATINIQAYSLFFGGCPVVQVPGRLYPIQVEYVKLKKKEETGKGRGRNDEGRDKRSAKNDHIDPEDYLRLLHRVDQEYREDERGDMLVFVSGMSDMGSLQEVLSEYAQQSQRWIILTLHSALSLDEQDKVFDIAPDGVRKCIISTNIAETSVTIDGIRFVVDSGKAKEMNFDGGLRMQSLQQFWISKAEAEQRKGRAGRTGPGVCYRMYSESDFSNFTAFPVPEIQRLPLESAMLNVKLLTSQDPRAFPYLERPTDDSIEQAIAVLKDHGALENNGTEAITPLGHVLTRLPVEISNGKMLIYGSLFQISDVILTVASCMTVQSPFLRVDENNTALLQQRRTFDSEEGDAFTLLRLYDEWIMIKGGQSRPSRKWCKQHAVEEQRLYEVQKLKNQFKKLLEDDREVGDVLLSADRRSDRRRLKQMRVEKEKKRKMKMLQMDGPDAEEKDDAEVEEYQIHDLDFKISNNIENLVARSRAGLSHREVILIKFIIASGLYPNVAFPDANNGNRKGPEQMYHTRRKFHVNMHPMSVYSSSHEALSRNHVVVFGSLLETNKVYLVHCIRMPCLHTLLLLSRSIDSNTSCSRILVDGWVKISIDNSDKARVLLRKAYELRESIAQMLDQKLRLSTQKPVAGGPPTQGQGAYQVPAWLHEAGVDPFRDDEILDRLDDYFSMDIAYSLELIRPELDGDGSNLASTGTPGGEGVQVADYMRVGAIDDDAWSMAGLSEHMQKQWQCPACKKTFMYNLLEARDHRKSCPLLE